MIKRCLVLQSALAVSSPSEAILAPFLQTVAMVPVEERNAGFRKASALGWLFLPSTVCYQGVETQSELLPFQEVTFGVPHRQKKDYSTTKPSFLEAGCFQGCLGTRRTGSSAARSLPFGPPARRFA